MQKEKKETACLQKRVLTFKEALDYLGISKSLLYKLTSSRGITYSKPNGGKIFFQKFETKNTEFVKQSLSKSAAGCYSIAAGNDADSVSRVTMNFDLCHSVPPQSAPDFIKNSPLRDQANAFGYVEVDKITMQHSRFPNVFALGDCTNAPCSKTGAAIRKQAPVVVTNLLEVMDKKPVTAQYDGYSACPIPTQYGKLMLAEFDYANKPKMTFPFDQAKPRWTMWILKTKVLPLLYWNKILKGTA